MRCFVGIPLPESYQHGLQEIVRAWKGHLSSRISWTRRGNWHMTLAFLGEIDEESQELVQKCLRGVSMEPFQLQAEGGGFFPPGKSPRVLWVGVGQGREASIRLADKVEQALGPAGYRNDKRPFQPHLTLGRVKQAKADDWAHLLRALQAMHWPVVEIDSIRLWMSRLSPQGPEYSCIEEYPLVGSDGSDRKG